MAPENPHVNDEYPLKDPQKEAERQARIKRWLAEEKEGKKEGKKAANKEGKKEAQKEPEKPKTPRKKQGSALEWPDTEPWEHPVTGSVVLGFVQDMIEKFVHLPPGASSAAALWAVMTWLHADERLSISPFLRLTSPSKRCGKSLLLEVISEFTYRTLSTSSISPAAIFRVIEDHQPTLLLDEVDNLFRSGDQGSELLGVVCGSQKRSEAWVVRTVAEGRDYETRKFSTWAPKLLAGIGQLPDTVVDRSVTIVMARAEKRLPKWRTRDHDSIAVIRSMIARWIADSVDKIFELRDLIELPDSLSDRQQDAWEILFAIAAVAGGDWLEKVENAAKSLSDAASDRDPASDPEQLARDVVRLLAASKERDIFSQELLVLLFELEDSPWADKKLSPYMLSRLGKLLGWPPTQTIRKGSVTRKGWPVDRLLAACARYSSAQHFSNSDTSDTNDTNVENIEVTTPPNRHNADTHPTHTSSENVSDCDENVSEMCRNGDPVSPLKSTIVSDVSDVSPLEKCWAEPTYHEAIDAVVERARQDRRLIGDDRVSCPHEESDWDMSEGLMTGTCRQCGRREYMADAGSAMYFSPHGS